MKIVGLTVLGSLIGAFLVAAAPFGESPPVVVA